jgi:hypothetical protein
LTAQNQGRWLLAGPRRFPSFQLRPAPNSYEHEHDPPQALSQTRHDRHGGRVDRRHGLQRQILRGDQAGANERINVAVIGIRNQGTVHLNSWCGLKDSHNVQVRTVCDTDEALFDAAVKLVEQKTGAKPGTTWDMRTVFDDKTIDVVSIVTPNHWHALATSGPARPGSTSTWRSRRPTTSGRAAR